MGTLWVQILSEVPVKALFKGLSCKLAPRRGRGVKILLSL